MGKNKYKQIFDAIKNNKYSITFFLVYLIIGVFIFKDYGIGWDESICIKNGVINAFEINTRLNYKIISKDKSDKIISQSGLNDKISNLDNFQDKYYGSINEMILLAPSFLLKSYNDTQKLILIRHLMIFLIFWISVIFFYKIIKIRYNSEPIAIIGSLFLILSPRIFAESFYNSKDIVFLSFIIFSIYTFINFYSKNNYKTAFIHALITGLVIAVRIPGTYIFCLTIIFLIFSFLRNKNNFQLKTAYPLLLYIIFTFLFTFIFWPYLWTGNPLVLFSEAFLFMKKFYYTLDVLYLGKLIYAQDLPWHYSIIWIIITTPLIYVLLFFIGVYSIFKSLKKSKFLEILHENVIDYFSFLIFLIPVLLVIIFNSVLYNGWRQLYFVYPGFILTSISGLMFCKRLMSKYKLSQWTLWIVIAAILSFNAYEIYRLHPYQMVYFNVIANNKPYNNFEYEYWGLTYKEGLKKLLNWNKESDTLKIFKSEFSPITGSLRILTSEERTRIKFTEFDSSDYIISNYSEFFNNKENFKKRYNLKNNQEIDSIIVDGYNVLGIYRLGKNNFIDSTIHIPMLSDGVGRLAK